MDREAGRRRGRRRSRSPSGSEAAGSVGSNNRWASNPQSTQVITLGGRTGRAPPRRYPVIRRAPSEARTSQAVDPDPGEVAARAASATTHPPKPAPVSRAPKTSGRRTARRPIRRAGTPRPRGRHRAVRRGWPPSARRKVVGSSVASAAAKRCTRSHSLPAGGAASAPDWGSTRCRQGSGSSQRAHQLGGGLGGRPAFGVGRVCQAGASPRSAAPTPRPCRR